jgi:hypothetical protein
MVKINEPPERRNAASSTVLSSKVLLLYNQSAREHQADSEDF